MESIVLLKNDDALLPLTKASVKSISIVGNAADAQVYNPNVFGGDWAQGDYYAGGGSGHVVAPYVVSPRLGIEAAASHAGIEVLHKGGDVTVVVCGTTSGEGSDRASLHFDGGCDETVAAQEGPTVVVGLAPGAVLMPWREQVSAILCLFLGGQETGAAIASVLFGERAPAGRLPIMLPASAADTIEPGSMNITYSEGMATSYRNSKFKAAFPFGHGLTYTDFKFGQPEAASCQGHVCIKLQIENLGTVAAKAVPQLYLEFPAEAKHPSALLKGFQKTKLIEPKAKASVTFVLTERDLSYWEAGKWIKAPKVDALVGASVADIKHRITDMATDAYLLPILQHSRSFVV